MTEAQLTSETASVADTKLLMAYASGILRNGAASDESAAALVIAALTLLGGYKAVPGEDMNKHFINRMREMAEVLSPMCPHCGKYIHLSPESEKVAANGQASRPDPEEAQ